MNSRKSLAQNRLPKDRILYCDRCGISFLWSGEEQQMATRPPTSKPIADDAEAGDAPEVDGAPEVEAGEIAASVESEPFVLSAPLGKTGTAKVPTHCAGCRVLMPNEGRERGVVKWYNPRKRFGFITRTDGTDLFAHGSRLKNAKRLRDGALVEFRATESKQGPAATEIQVLEEHPLTTVV